MNSTSSHELHWCTRIQYWCTQCTSVHVYSTGVHVYSTGWVEYHTNTLNNCANSYITTLERSLTSKQLVGPKVNSETYFEDDVKLKCFALSQIEQQEKATWWLAEEAKETQGHVVRWSAGWSLGGSCPPAVTDVSPVSGSWIMKGWLWMSKHCLSLSL